MKIFIYHPDSILTLAEVCEVLRLDQRTVKRIALKIGGRRFGSRLRFRWGTVMEYFQNADFEKGSWECMAGQSSDQWTNCGQQVFPAGTDKWARMDGSQNMGGGKEKRAGTGYGKKAKDPFGLRDILGLG